MNIEELKRLAVAKEILNNPDSCSAYLHNMAVHAVGKATT